MINLSFERLNQIDNFPAAVAAIGFFDGIHKGHQKVILRAVQVAKEKKLESAVITFHPHPSFVLKNNKKKIQYITPLDEKKSILKSLGVNRVYVIEFNKELSLLSAEQFIEQYIKRLNINHLIAGFDFTYGHKGVGNMNNLKEFAKDDFTYETIEKVKFNNEKISSTRIRQLIRNGEIEHVTTLLGRHLSLKAEVIEGDKRGREIGFPTANLKIDEDYLLPKIGAYIVEVEHQGKIYMGMANLGIVPTFNKDQTLSLEVHILDFDEMIYGETLIIKWHQYLREERKFSGIEHIVNQLKTDEIHVRQYFKKYQKN